MGNISKMSKMSNIIGFRWAGNLRTLHARSISGLCPVDTPSYAVYAGIHAFSRYVTGAWRAKKAGRQAPPELALPE